MDEGEKRGEAIRERAEECGGRTAIAASLYSPIPGTPKPS